MQVHLSFIIFFAAILTLSHAGKKDLFRDFCKWFKKTFHSRFPGCKEDVPNPGNPHRPSPMSGGQGADFGYPYHTGAFGGTHRPKPRYPYQPSTMSAGDLEWPKPSYPYQPSTMSAGDLESGAKTWKGEFCTLRRFPQVVRDGKCQEEIQLSWKNTKTEKIFRLNCPGIHSFIPIVVKKSLIIVGGPNDEFCLFSNDENALYYKISGSWTKFEILIDHVNEQPLQPQEISKVTERILKWKEVIDYANRKEKEYTKGMEDEDQRHAAEMKKCDQSLEEQKEITEKTMQGIKKLRDDEDKIHESKMKEVGKIKDEHAKSEARNNESNRHATRVNEINQKEALEKDRLLNNAGHITNRLHTEELKHKQQSQNFKNLLDQEEERFQMEFNNLKSIGY